MMTPAADPSADKYRYKYLIGIAVTMAAMLELIDTSIVNVAIPMMGNLGATLDEISWVSTGYIIANVIVIPMSGWLSAYFGRRRYLTFSIGLFVVASFFCGASRSLEALVLWRVVQGLGGGALLSTAQSTLWEAFPPKEVAIGQAMFGVGIMVGPYARPHARRIHRRQLGLAVDLLHQPSAWPHRRADGVELRAQRRAPGASGDHRLARHRAADDRAWDRCSGCSSGANVTTGSSRDS